MKNIEKMFAIAMLLGAVIFNLYLYRLEPTAKVDPNDNLFQYALVERTSEIWNFAQHKCSLNPVCFVSYLIDHWVPNWNEGYNLPFYYSHVPQIVIVGSWRLLSLLATGYSLFTYYHLVIYLLLCLFPISMFFAMRVAKFPWITAGLAAILASHISTDGLYGLDPPSFLWRGYGLSSQLFAMIFLPLAIAYAWRYFQSQESYRHIRSSLLPAILFLVLTTSGHLGIGIMAFLSLIPLAVAGPLMDFVRQQWNRDSWQLTKINILKLAILSGTAVFILSYWIVPALLGDKFHNFSFWDPVWKFNSYGAKDTLTRLFNGDLFDFGRLPIYTGLVLTGIFSAVGGKIFADRFSSLAISPLMDSTPVASSGSRKFIYEQSYFAFGLLFLFWLLLYFGRTTWGNLINLIPAMREFHLSRFIVGVHIAGLFLAPIGLTWIVSSVMYLLSPLKKFHFSIFNFQFIRLFVYSFICLLILFPIYQQTISYNQLNDTLIKQANGNFDKQSPDADALVTTLQNLEKTSPGRVFSGRGGSWGHEFKIAETNMTMYLGNFGLPTVMWLPETWSPNGDTEQYFREDKEEDYGLYNIRYVATPITLAKEQIQPFWKKITAGKTWILYSIDLSSLGNVSNLSGYFTAGVRPAIVAADKYSRNNVVRLWIQSDDPKNGLYPQLTFDTRKYPVNTGLPNFKMLDEVTFQVPDGTTHNVFASPPRYISPLSDLSTLSHLIITDQKDNADMIFTAHVTVPNDCKECLVILKQSYHPNWRITVDGSPVTPIITFPFYIGIPVTAGNHTIVASYEPSTLKVVLLFLILTVCMIFAIIHTYDYYKHFSSRKIEKTSG